MHDLFNKNNTIDSRESISRLISWGHWFLCFNILLAMLIAIRFMLASPLPSTGLGQIYLLVSWIGHFGFIGFIVFLLTVFPLSFVFRKPSVLRTSSVLIATGIQTLLLIDTQVYQLLKFHINPLVWNLLFEHSQSKSNLNWNFLFIAVPVIILLEIIFSALAWKRQYRRTSPLFKRGMVSLFLVCFLLTHLVHIWADASFYTPITAQRSNFPLSYPMTARSFLARHGWIDMDEFKAKEQTQPAQPHRRLLYPLASPEVSAHDSKTNLLLIVVRGLRADMLNNVNMPNLARFADQHQQFSQHMAGDIESTPSLFSLFYGLPAQYADDVQADELSPVLLDEMQRQEYLIRAFASSGLNQSMYQQAIFRGLRQKPERHPQQTDVETLARWQTWTRALTGARPWFSFVMLDAPGNLIVPNDAAAPFQPELKQLDLLGKDPKQPELLKNRYKNAVFYVDQLLGQLFDQLQTQRLIDNTLVVITSDHGFELGETNPNHWGAGNSYAQQEMQVPLVMSWPGRPSLRHAELTSHQDLVPTLMQELLGVTSSTADFSTGRSLFSETPRDWVIAGNSRQFVIMEPNQITLFDRQGDFEIRHAENYQPIDEGRPEMPVLLKVMRDLGRFKSDSELTPHKN